MSDSYNLEQQNAQRLTQNNFIIPTNISDIMIPFIKLVQNTSDELIVGREKYDASVKAGDFYDSITKTVFENPKVIVCGMKKYYTEWTTRVGRGKVIKKHLDNSDIVKTAKKEPYKKSDGSIIYNLNTQNGHALVESYGAIFLIKNSNGLLLPGRFEFSSSSFVEGKKLNTNLALYQSGGVPVFSLSSNLTSNSKGSWYKPVIKFIEYEKEQKIIDFAIKLSKIAEDVLLK